ncbi:hypothetical protein ZIOFF_002712 [Zingiber officinale]|uniref:Uncharacterized protein n=1 Tax=Zingiber officinale TaxID=94328 RepID=A0A8J5M9P2_ZINOF|nr:hypothetical protein ZIOFF_002712 [Zingiber officinale]
MIVEKYCLKKASQNLCHVIDPFSDMEGAMLSHHFVALSARNKESIVMDKRISSSQEAEVRKGPWTMEEDLILINYISNHGEGVWNNIARSAGIANVYCNFANVYCNIARVCRVEEDREELQAEVAELPPPGRAAGEHHAGGAAADHGAPRPVGEQVSEKRQQDKQLARLPGRTDNEIKNFWRTRVQKKLKQCESFVSLKNNPVIIDDASTSALRVDTAGNVSSGVHQVCDDNIIGGDRHHADDMVSEGFSTESSDNFWSLEDFWLLN